VNKEKDNRKQGEAMDAASVDFGYLRMRLAIDADSILDGIEWDHAKSAQAEDELNSAMSSIFCPPKPEDTKELTAAAIAYAEDQPLPRLRSAQRWRFAMRLRLAAAMLQPFDKKHIDCKSSLYRQVAQTSPKDLAKWLLTDGVWFYCAIFNEIAFCKERVVRAPDRPPWKPDLIIRRGAG